MSKRRRLFNTVMNSSISMPVLTLAILDRARETGVFPERQVPEADDINQPVL